jgi:hypothetical protein
LPLLRRSKHGQLRRFFSAKLLLYTQLLRFIEFERVSDEKHNTGLVWPDDHVDEGGILVAPKILIL